MAPSAFGRACSNDPRLVSSLLEGRSPTSNMIDRIQHFMKTYKVPK